MEPMSDADFPPCRWRDDGTASTWRVCSVPVPASAVPCSGMRVSRHDCARCPVREERSARERILERIEGAMSPNRTLTHMRARVREIVEEELPE